MVWHRVLLTQLFSLFGCQGHLLAGFSALLGSHSNGVSWTHGPSVPTSKDDLPNRWALLNIYVWAHLFWTWKFNKAFHFLKRWWSLSVVSWQPPGVSFSMVTLGHMGLDLGHSVWQAAILFKFLLPIAMERMTMRPEADGGCSLCGPVDHVYREVNSNSCLQAGKCSLILYSPPHWGRLGTLGKGQDSLD